VATDLDSLFDRLGRFKRDWLSRGWSWDRRLDCVASTFDIMDIDAARQLVTDLFPEAWTPANLKRAPDLVTEVADATGGVRSDQVLYAMPEIRGVLPYGLWWPWGSEGSNISMRVGLAGPGARNEIIRLRRTFGALED
jgi:hypothetical protein